MANAKKTKRIDDQCQRVDRDSRGSFPASDAPSFNPSVIGAPANRQTPPIRKQEIDAAAKRKNLLGRFGA
jgi:hypothetical protein